MDLKNLMSIVVRPVNRTTTEELPAKEFAQLSEEEMQQIWGGGESFTVEAEFVSLSVLLPGKGATGITGISAGLTALATLLDIDRR
jgi:hypothetical protein